MLIAMLLKLARCNLICIFKIIMGDFQDMGVNYTTYNGSRALYDQHRDMRLDIDNMSYEVTY